MVPLSFFWLPALAQAQAAPLSQPAAGPEVVLLLPSALRSSATDFVRSVQSQLAGLPVRLQLHWEEETTITLPSQVRAAQRVAARRKAIGVFWADYAKADQLFILLAEKGGGRILVRSVAEEKSREGRLEAIAVIVRASVQAMLGGADLSIRSMWSPVKLKAPPPPRLQLSAAYGFYNWGEGSGVSHGAELGISLRVLSWLHVQLAYRLQLAFEVDSAAGTTRFSPHPIVGGAQVAWALGRWRLGGGAGLVVDYLGWSQQGAPPGVAVDDAEGRWRVAAFTSLTARFLLTPRIALFASMGLDLPFNERRYAIESAGGPLQLVDPWPVIPWSLLGISVFLL